MLANNPVSIQLCRIMKSNRLIFFLICWLAAGGTIFCIRLIGGRDLIECVVYGIVWGALIAAVPAAIQGSILKSKKK